MEPFWVFEGPGPVFALSTNRVDDTLLEGSVDVILVLGDTTASSLPLRPSTDLDSTGPLCCASIRALPYHCLPCFSESLLWQRLIDSAITTILSITFRQEANICGTYWLSERWKEQYNQYVEGQQGLQGGPDSGRDEGWSSNGDSQPGLIVALGLAIYYAHTADISYRLSWDRANLCK